PAGSADFAAIELSPLFAGTSVIGVTAMSCFALRLVVETFVGDDTKLFKAVLTSAVWGAGGFWPVVMAADLGCGIVTSACIDTFTRFGSVVDTAVLVCAGVFSGATFAAACCSDTFAGSPASVLTA